MGTARCLLPLMATAMVVLPIGSVRAFLVRPFLGAAPQPAAGATALRAEPEGPPPDSSKKRVVVVGNGMVGQRFLENLRALDPAGRCRLSAFCAEPRAAYNRVKLTSYFATQDPSALSLTGAFDADGRTTWYEENNVELLVGDPAVAVDTQSRVVMGASGAAIPYDALVLATGSVPFVPPIPGRRRPGVFVYRTIEDLEKMLAYARDHRVRSAAIIGGGLLGLEAAKAAQDMGLESHIVEFAPILMCRQIDPGGHNALVGKIEAMGLRVHCGARTAAFVGADGTTDNDSAAPVAALRFSNDGWADLPVQMVIVSTGIQPRDDLARAAGLDRGDRGGVVVDDHMRTSRAGVYAIGECALHNHMVYGLVAPGYTMADVAAHAVAHDLGLLPPDAVSPRPRFTGADMSTKLKLMGCDVASFGVNQPSADDTDVSELVWNDPVQGIYRKLIFNKAGTRLRGGILVGDAADYHTLHKLTGVDEPLACSAAALLPPLSARDGGAPDAGDSEDPAAQICSCNDVTRGAIAATIEDLGAEQATLAAIKKCTRAGTGCGGCEPQLKTVLKHELERLGSTLSNHLCEHFQYSRQELMALVRTAINTETVDSFEKILAKHGTGDGCEICKPTIASILASVFNGNTLDDGRAALQDTNDRALANMQRGGTYSVVPRVPGGELTPSQLIVLGQVAEKYGLYTKVTGGQRIDLFGAAKHELPDIWEELGDAGFESGHAYGKALRTVKSCVGSTWCRYGVQDSVSFAIQVENRYKGIRAPHKLKGGVSGCVRECAEAQGKDFGLIATENGYNLYVGGNGGSNPVHAELLVADIDTETAIKYLDRYLMYYILTADRLERTAVWQKKLPGGKKGGGAIEHLKEVIIADSLGICHELDARMQHLVDTYHDEWAAVVKDPIRRAQFQQFVNTEVTIPKQDMIEFVDIRGQKRPADWPKDGAPQTNWRPPAPNDVFRHSAKSWVAVGAVVDFPPNAGAPILYGDSQLAVFHNARRGEWHCTQNMCPHKQAFVLSQGLVGDAGGLAKVACPLHKKTFALDDGEEIGGDLGIITFPVRIVDGRVLVELPAVEEVDAILGTHGLRVRSSPAECGVAVTGAAAPRGSGKRLGFPTASTAPRPESLVLRAHTGNATAAEETEWTPNSD